MAGYLERNEPLLDQPGRKAIFNCRVPALPAHTADTAAPLRYLPNLKPGSGRRVCQCTATQQDASFVTSHFYLDDFVQSSEDPNPQPLQRTPLQAIPEEGFRTPAEATDEDVRLARRYQGGTRFVEDDLVGDPEAGALASNGQGPPSITDRLRSTADGAQAAADLIGAQAAELAAAQAFRSQLPQDAAEYVRLNVLPRPGPAQPPPQIVGRPVTWSASWTRRGSARRRWSVARRQ